MKKKPPTIILFRSKDKLLNRLRSLPPLKDVAESLIRGKSDKDGNPGPVLKIRQNLYGILLNDIRAGTPRFNELLQTPEVRLEGEDWRPLTDEMAEAVAVFLSSAYGLHAGTDTVSLALRTVAQDLRHNPLRDYLENLPAWDGEERISGFLGRWKTRETPLLDQISRRWFVSAVARGLDPGCKVDTVLILQGPQGAGKSSAFRALCPDHSWFMDSGVQMGNRDGYLALSGRWIVELAELASYRKSESDEVKAFLAARHDTFRPPYARAYVTVPRNCVIVGSTNDDQFLRDPTGSRRFWVAPVADLDVTWIEENRDQLWSEAVAAFRAGERWWMDAGEQAILEEGNLEFREEDPWTDPVAEWLEKLQKEEGRRFTTMAEALEKGVGLPPDRQLPAHQKRMRDVLRALGWRPGKKRRTSGRPINPWEPPGDENNPF